MQLINNVTDVIDFLKCTVKEKNNISFFNLINLKDYGSYRFVLQETDPAVEVGVFAQLYSDPRHIPVWRVLKRGPVPPVVIEVSVLR